MTAQSESWRKKADSNEADLTVLEGGQIRSRQEVFGHVGFLQLREISICTAVP